MVPPEIDRWNWGAFLLSWIWGVGNRVYIAFFALIPVVGVVMLFVLGVKGSTWAWQNKTWPNIERFRAVQRQWTVAGLIVWGALLTLGIAGGLLAPDPGEEALSQTVVSEDGRLRMKVPPSWVESDRLLEEAELQAEHEFEELYVVVVRQSKIDFAPSVDLRRFARIAREGITESLEDGRLTRGPVDITVGGRPAIQAELEGTLDGVRIVYVHTSIQAPDGFVEVIAWTVPSLIEEARGLLQEITESVTIQS